jgi:hypothetical protein
MNARFVYCLLFCLVDSKVFGANSHLKIDDYFYANEKLGYTGALKIHLAKEDEWTDIYHDQSGRLKEDFYKSGQLIGQIFDNNLWRWQMMPQEKTVMLEASDQLSQTYQQRLQLAKANYRFVAHPEKKRIANQPAQHYQLVSKYATPIQSTLVLYLSTHNGFPLASHWKGQENQGSHFTKIHFKEPTLEAYMPSIPGDYTKKQGAQILTSGTKPYHQLRGYPSWSELPFRRVLGYSIIGWKLYKYQDDTQSLTLLYHDGLKSFSLMITEPHQLTPFIDKNKAEHCGDKMIYFQQMPNGTMASWHCQRWGYSLLGELEPAYIKYLLKSHSMK